MNPHPTFFPRQTVDAGTNRWDWALLPLVLGLLVLLGYGASQMARPYHLGDLLPLLGEYNSNQAWRKHK